MYENLVNNLTPTLVNTTLDMILNIIVREQTATLCWIPQQVTQQAGWLYKQTTFLLLWSVFRSVAKNRGEASRIQVSCKSVVTHSHPRMCLIMCAAEQLTMSRLRIEPYLMFFMLICNPLLCDSEKREHFDLNLSLCFPVFI